MAIRYYLRNLINTCQSTWTSHTYGVSNYQAQEFVRKKRLHHEGYMALTELGTQGHPANAS